MVSKNLLISLALIALVLSSLSVPVGAEAPPPPQGPYSPDYSSFPSPSSGGNPAPQSPGRLAAVPLPTYSLAKSFGILQEPYIEDTTHVNLPWGVAFKNNKLYIADSYGNRVLIYNNDGTFSGQIGKAGINDFFPTTTIRNIADIDVDSGGNIWVVDREASHVLKFNSSFNLVSELGVLWTPGSDNTHFGTPSGVAFDAAGNVYISDGAPDAFKTPSNERVQIFSSTGTYLATIGGTNGNGDFQFNGNRRLAIDVDNQLYVADPGNERVQIYNISNINSITYVATLGTTGSTGSTNTQFNNPSGVAVNASYIFVADTWNNRVQIFNRTTRAYVATLGNGPTTGTTNDKFHHNFDVAVEEPVSGVTNVYVADFDNSRVQMWTFDANPTTPVSTYVRTFGETRVPYVTTGNRFNQPRGMAVDAEGNLLVVEEYGQRLVKLSPNGDPLWTWGVPGIGALWNSGIQGFNDQYLNMPNDVAVRPSDGMIFVADRWNHRVQYFTPNGAFVGTLGYSSNNIPPPTPGTGNTQFNCPRGLGFGPDSALYVADTCNHRVQKFDVNLAYVTTFGTTGSAGTLNNQFNNPQDVAIDRNGQISVADSGNKRVQVFNTGGTYLYTIGTTGVSGNSPTNFSGPFRLDVDAANNLYAADGWNKVVRVYNNLGEYRGFLDSTISGIPKDIHGMFSIAVNPVGEVFLADYWDNARIQKFTWVKEQNLLPSLQK